MSEASTQAKHRAAAAVSAPSSPSELEHDIEATRERLAGTLDELIHRVKPSTIVSRQVESTKAHFVDAQGKMRADKVAAVAAAAVGVVAFLVVVRRLSNRKG